MSNGHIVDLAGYRARMEVLETSLSAYQSTEAAINPVADLAPVINIDTAPSNSNVLSFRKLGRSVAAAAAAALVLVTPNLDSAGNQANSVTAPTLAERIEEEDQDVTLEGFQLVSDEGESDPQDGLDEGGVEQDFHLAQLPGGSGSCSVYTRADGLAVARGEMVPEGHLLDLQTAMLENSPEFAQNMGETSGRIIHESYYKALGINTDDAGDAITDYFAHYDVNNYELANDVHNVQNTMCDAQGNVIDYRQVTLEAGTFVTGMLVSEVKTENGVKVLVLDNGEEVVLLETALLVDVYVETKDGGRELRQMLATNKAGIEAENGEEVGCLNFIFFVPTPKVPETTPKTTPTTQSTTTSSTRPSTTTSSSSTSTTRPSTTTSSSTTTSTTRPSTTTSSTTSTTITTTTSSTIPETTTTTIDDKDDDDKVPGNSSIPADQDPGTPDVPGQGPAGQAPNEDGYLPTETRPSAPTTVTTLSPTTTKVTTPATTAATQPTGSSTPVTTVVSQPNQTTPPTPAP